MNNELDCEQFRGALALLFSPTPSGALLSAREADAVVFALTAPDNVDVQRELETFMCARLETAAREQMNNE